MIPAWTGPYVFGFLVSGMMSFLVSGVATLRSFGFVEGVGGLWMNAWLPSWGIAFPTILIVAPLVRRFVAKLVVAPR